MHSYHIFEVYVPWGLQCNVDMKDAHSWYIWTGITPDEDMIHLKSLDFRRY